jgi:signal transduction histidine kinase
MTDVVIVLLTCMNLCLLVWQRFSRQKMNIKRQPLSGGGAELTLLKTVLMLETKERHRIANTLHQKSSSTLAAVRMYLAAIQSSGPDRKEKGDFEQVHVLLESAYGEINMSLYSLMPEMALENGIDEAVRKYCSHLTSHKLLSIEYDSWGCRQRFHEAFELSVFRCIQTLLNYMIRQATATSAVVQLSIREHLLTVSVEDNGPGYQPVALLLEDAWLTTLEDVIRRLDGQFELRSDNGLSAFIQLETGAFAKAGTLMQPAYN